MIAKKGSDVGASIESLVEWTLRDKAAAGSSGIGPVLMEIWPIQSSNPGLLPVAQTVALGSLSKALSLTDGLSKPPQELRLLI